MTIDMDKVWDAIKPRPLALRIDGADYDVRRLTVADARRISQFSEHSDEENLRWLRSLFVTGAPAFLERFGNAKLAEDEQVEARMRALTILDVVGTYYMQEHVLEKKLLAAHHFVRAEMTGVPPETTTPSSESSSS